MVKVGDRIEGRYEILRSIGQGGMGSVYEALHLELGRRVAVKVLDGSTDVARLAQEARALATLNHPNVVQLIYARGDAHPPFIVMDLVEGKSIDQLIEECGRIEPRRAAMIGAQLLSALAAAHRAGIIHRDVKPSNVLVTDAGPMRDLVKVVDFGLAKLAVDPLKHTTTGTLLGSLAYMAPEQLLGRPVDARVDIFASGVSLYKMLSGRFPFDGASAPQVVLAICENEPPTLDAPPQLRAIVERAMRKNPAERFATADEMCAALEAFASGAAYVAPAPAPAAQSMFASTVTPPVVALSAQPPPPPFQPPPFQPPQKRSALPIVIGASLAGLSVIGIVVAVVVLRGGAAATTPRPILAIDIPKESAFTQAEEDAVRRSLPSFEKCVARQKIAVPVGSRLIITHGSAVTFKNASGGGAIDLNFLACVEAVDQRIPGVHANGTYHVRL